MTDNPYESPRADLSPTGYRSRVWAWWQDRLALIGSALLVTVVLGGITIASIALGFSQRTISFMIMAVFAVVVALVKRGGRGRQP